MPLLVVVPPGPVDLRDGLFRTTAKFADGMAMYAELWPGEVAVVGTPADVADDSNLGAVALDLDALPYDVVTTSDVAGTLRSRATDAAVLPLDERHADLIGAAHRTVLAAEHTGRSRLEMLLASPVGPVDRLRAEVGFRRLTPRLQRLVSRADGVQCNGQVAWEAYAPHSRAPLRVYDSRLRLAEVQEARQRRAGRTPDGTLRLAFSGRLLPIKGPEHAVEVHRRLRAAGHDVALDVYGDGPMLAGLRADAPDVTFHGSLDFASEWCPAVSGSTDLMLLPHVQSDPAGTYLESAGMGVPVLGFDNVALRHLVDVAGLGWTVPLRRNDLLARKVQELAERPEELQRAGEAGIAFMEEHCFEHDFAARVEHLLDLVGSAVE
ncbi:glycosyltransferase family 4 protein [Nocardioides zeicaulis]|uniref:Glycosyltransferase family 4 protein n=1 Tax=Nocardioides zeicaulis TaxID=1776857 RepID=A0ABV6DZS2_9ACTN